MAAPKVVCSKCASSSKLPAGTAVFASKPSPLDLHSPQTELWINPAQAQMLQHRSCAGARTRHQSVPIAKAQTSVFEVCGSSSDLRFRIQGQTGNRQPATAHGLRRAHAGILVYAGPLPESGNLRRLSRRTATEKTERNGRSRNAGRHAARIQHHRRDHQSSRRPQRRRSALRPLPKSSVPQELHGYAQPSDPARRDTVLGVSRKITFFSPQSVIIFRCNVLFLRRLCLTNFNLTDWNGTVLPNLRIGDPPGHPPGPCFSGKDGISCIYERDCLRSESGIRWRLRR
jgi:hypothetical protein